VQIFEAVIATDLKFAMNIFTLATLVRISKPCPLPVWGACILPTVWNCLFYTSLWLLTTQAVLFWFSWKLF